MSLSNFPPGHPTGVRRGDYWEVWECEHCHTLWESPDLNVGPVKHCRTKGCHKRLIRAECDTCGEPATHIDVDRSVNYCAPYCTSHHL